MLRTISTAVLVTAITGGVASANSTVQLPYEVLTPTSVSDSDPADTAGRYVTADPVSVYPSATPTSVSESGSSFEPPHGSSRAENYGVRAPASENARSWQDDRVSGVFTPQWPSSADQDDSAS